MRNVKRYYQAWELKQKGSTYREIGIKMGFSPSRAGELVRFVNRCTLRKVKPRALVELMQKYENK